MSNPQLRGTPRIICFDLGGVIVRICRSWGEACARAGIDERDPHRFNQPHLARARKELVERYQTGAMACGEFFDAVAAATDGLYSPQDVRRVHDAWIIEDYAGVGTLIERINALPHATSACLSNTNHAHWAGMLGLEGGAGHRSPSVELLEIKGASQLLRAAKPGTTIYQRAEDLFRAKGAEIVFFDDLEENIAAARAMGWHAHHINHEGDTAGQITAALRGHGIEM
jgi:FMN phosphatase YigB (HAD superfamily)